MPFDASSAAPDEEDAPKKSVGKFDPSSATLAPPTVDGRAALSGWDRFKTGVADVPLGAMQLGANATSFDPSMGIAPPQMAALEARGAQGVNQQMAGREKDYQAQRAAAGQDGVDWARLGGNVAATIPLGALGAAARGATLGGRLAGAALGGAGASALNPVTEGEYGPEKAKQAAIGAAVGPAAELTGNALSKVIKPTFDQAKTLLMSEGVKLTPGQMAGGALRATEDKATVLPIAGDAIRSARTKGLEDFNKAAWNRVLAPIGEKLPANVKAGADAANHVADKIDAAYAKVWPKVTATADADFMKDLTQIDKDAQASLPDAQYKQFRNILQSQLVQKDLSTGEALKGVDSTLGREAAGYKKNQDWDTRKLGDALDDLKLAFRGAVQRQNPQYAPEMDKLNQMYANYVRVSRAADALGAHGGIFTPAQLDNAVRAEDKSVSHRAFGKGKALLQDLSKAGMEVLPSTVPSSGTAERNTLVGSLLGAAAGLGHGDFGAVLGTTAGLAAGGIPYTGAGMSLLHRFAGVAPSVAGKIQQGQQSQLRNQVAELMRRIGTGSAPAMGSMAGDIAQPSPQGVPGP